MFIERIVQHSHRRVQFPFFLGNYIPCIDVRMQIHEQHRPVILKIVDVFVVVLDIGVMNIPTLKQRGKIVVLRNHQMRYISATESVIIENVPAQANKIGFRFVAIYDSQSIAMVADDMRYMLEIG